MNTFDEFLGFAAELEKLKVRYALIGGVAMAFHDAPRFTHDIDLLVESEDSGAVKSILEGAGYFASSLPWKFKNTNLELFRYMKTEGEEMMIVDVLLARDPEHKRMIAEALDEKSASGRVRVAKKEDLILLKSVRNSKLDQADIEKLQNGKD